MRIMRRFAALLCLLFAVFFTEAQPALKDMMLKPLRGKDNTFSFFSGKDSVILLYFWSVASDKSTDALNAIQLRYEKWKKEVSFKMMAVAVDEGKQSNRVRGMAGMNGWTFDVYTDVNGDLRQLFNVKSLPEAIVLKGDHVIYQQSGYESGTENYLFEKIKEVAK
jgi:hypothetical protein